MGSCQDVETLDISGFNFEIELGTETSSHQEEREIEIGHSQSPGDAYSMTTSSSSEEHELENDHSTSCQSNHSSLNNKPKRPLFEECIICEKSVKKMRDHLNYFHNLQSNPGLKVFLSSYYSTIRTKKCIQCETCLKRFSFKQVHPKHHKMTRIFNRQDEKMFPEAIQVALSGYRENKLKPYHQAVEEFDQYVQSLANNGDIVSVYRMSSSFKRFLTIVIHGTNEFDATKYLSNCVQRFQEETGIQKTTMQNYLAKLKKFFSYIELHASSRFPNYKNHPWEKTLEKVRVHFQQGVQKQKKKENKELQKKVPALDEVQRVNAVVVEFLRRDLRQKVLEYKELSALNFLILSFRLNCRSGTHFYRIKDSLGHMFAAHFEQTGHTKLTVLKNYVVPGDKIRTLQIYLDQLSILDKQGTG